MVIGLDRLRAHFGPYADKFVLIGGVAAHMHFTAAALPFRATKDIDMVLLIDAKDAGMRGRLWEFVRAADYAVLQRSPDNSGYFRFRKPRGDDFPVMLELFCRAPEGLAPPPDVHIVPLAAGDGASSLAAILMDDQYHALVARERVVVVGLPCATPAALILLKARAWLDLTARREAGEAVDAREITKHRNDVFRLTTLLVEDDSREIPAALHADLTRFLSAFPSESTEWRAITQAAGRSGLPGPATLRRVLEAYFHPQSV